MNAPYAPAEPLQNDSEREERLRQAVSVAHIGIFDHDHQSGRLYWSPEQRAHYGLNAAEPVSMLAFLALVHPEDREVVRDAVDRAHDPAGSGFFAIEHRILRRDGKVRWMSSRSSTLFEGSGAERRAVRTVGASIDVTERRRGDRALRSFRHSIDQAFDSVYWLDRHGRFVYCNAQACRGLGYSEEEMRRLTVFDIDHSMSMDDWRRRWEEAERTQETMSRSFETLHHRKDGSSFPVEAVVQYIPLAGEETLHIGYARDISERKRAAETLQASEERFRALIEHGLDLMLTFGADGRFQFCSPSTLSILGYAPEELKGERVLDYVHPDDASRVQGMLSGLLSGELRTVHASARLRHKDGRWREVEGMARNLLDVPAVRAVVTNAHDVTEQRLLEARMMEADKLDSIGRLAGGIAHDFNNILTSILGHTELLLADVHAGAAVQVEDLEEVRAAGERARSLTAQLLAFARRQVVSPRKLDLNRVVEGSRRMLERLLGEDIKVETALQPGLGSVEVDQSQIEQVILNLAINARDAMPSGGRLRLVTADVTLSEEDAARHADVRPGHYVRLGVSDTGVGIAAEKLAYIFEPFYTTKPAGKGTGLGLATVYGIVRQSGGHLSVSSQPGQGTHFSLFFPRAGQAAEAPAPAAPSPPRTSAGRETLLLVEDDPQVRTITARALLDAGYRVLVAASPEEGLKMALRAGETIDLLVTDVVMPGLSGKALADRIRAQLPKLRVMFVSGYTDDAIVQHGVLEQGINFLQKPFTPSRLREQVRAVLDAPGTL